MNSERWDGGYVRTERDGRRTWVIERRVGGRRYHISTRAHSERAAYEHLKRFEADPAGYEQAMRDGATAEPLALTVDLAMEFRRWMLERDRPTTRKHANEMFHRLAEWEDDLRGRDLRAVALPDLKEVVARRQTCRQHRIIAIKALYGWLRTEKCVLDRRTDPTLDLTVPQAVPEKHRRRKTVPVEHVRAALAHLAPAYRDCLYLLARTGWHVTELARFAHQPEARIAPGRGDVLAVLQVLHKSGATTRTPLLEEEAVRAARRVRERGGLPRHLNAAIATACRAAGVPPFGAGVMRHTVATWAVETGSPAEVVAEFLGHADKRTTLTFYADAAVPSATVRLPGLL